jgi:hypothetical protein
VTEYQGTYVGTLVAVGQEFVKLGCRAGDTEFCVRKAAPHVYLGQMRICEAPGRCKWTEQEITVYGETLYLTEGTSACVSRGYTVDVCASGFPRAGERR